MMEKLKIPYPVIVEGKYDKIKLDAVMEGQILTTDGFRLFNHGETLALCRRLAEKSRIILLTDSDGAGKLIRSKITSSIPRERLIQLYIPRVEGKEKRKTKASAEGTLGVEGMEVELLRSLLAPYAVGEGENADTPDKTRAAYFENPLSKTDFYIDGLTGGTDSTKKRDEFAASLGLPPGMTPNALLAATKLLLTYGEYLQKMGRQKE
jgi:ribonuclease M5